MTSPTSVRLVEPGTSRTVHKAAISGGNPSSTGALGLAPIGERPDERQRTVVDRVHEARPKLIGQTAIGHNCGILDGLAQGVQVSLAKSGVYPLEPARFGATLPFSVRGMTLD